MAEPNERVFIDFIVKQLAEFTMWQEEKFTANTMLIGSEAPIQSREIVELFLAVEEYMEDEFDVEFDWTSDSAMSQARSIFRNVGTLANHLAELANSK